MVISPNIDTFHAYILDWTPSYNYEFHPAQIEKNLQNLKTTYGEWTKTASLKDSIFHSSPINISLYNKLLVNINPISPDHVLKI